MRMVIPLVVLLVFLTGCVETLIGAYAYRSSKTRQAKQEFMANFNETNIEREKAGLPPLDLCTEQYYYDKKWADNDPVCAERIVKYEAGDKTALGHPQLELKEEAAAPTPGQSPIATPIPAPTLAPTPIPQQTSY
jgi:hypothetical protein